MESATAPAARQSDDPSLYINRELSWLEFNRRVLEEAQDPSVPLLERLKFLAIFESNLDEFFMVRVGGLQQKVQAGIAYGSGADRHARQGTARTHRPDRPRSMTAETYRCLAKNVLPALEHEGIVIRGLKDLTDADKRHLHDGLSPRDLPGPDAAGHRSRPPLPAPAQQVAQPGRDAAAAGRRGTAVRRRAGAGACCRASCRCRPSRERPAPRLHAAGNGHPPAPAGAVSRHERSSRDAVFRVTRNSDIEIDDDEVEDLLKTIEEEVRKRRRGAAVRLQIEADAPPRSSSS